jgi:HAE1 family hydrophobic/amphiphilic exporter-1
MQWLASLSVRRPVVAWVMILLVMVLGLAGYAQIGVDRFPKVEIPSVTIITRLPGAAPREVETEVTDKVEAAVNTISGIDELRSTSSEGTSTVIISFVLDKQIDVAVQETRDALAGIQIKLPQGVEPPIVNKIDPDATPILLIGVDSPLPERDLTEFADKKLRPRLENVRGVGQVTLVGGRKREINVWLDPARLAAYGITAIDVQRAIARENLSQPGGALDSGPRRITVRLEGRVSSVEALSGISVRQVDGRVVRIGDVATVEDGAEEALTSASRDGLPALILSIRKQSGANTIEVADAIEDRLADIRKAIPPSMKIEILRDNAASTRTSLDAVREHLVVGAIFAALVVLLFLGDVRSTLIAGLAIPTSVIGTFAFLWMFKFTLNTISMLGLALSVGIVIDDAIVVLENIHRYIQHEHVKPFQAAILATREIGLAVLATTLSLIAVFLPVAFMGGVPGRFLSSFGWTMAFAIAVSLFVSFTLTPMLSARWLKPHDPAARPPLLERMSNWVMWPLDWAYHAMLRFVTWQRWTMVLLTILAFASIPVVGGRVPKGFLPKSDEALIEIGVRTPEGTTLAATRLAAQRIGNTILREVPESDLVIVTIGDNNDRKPNRAAVSVRLIDPADRSDSQDIIMDRIRRDIASKAPKDLVVTVSNAGLFGGAGQNAQVQYQVTGPDLDTLIDLSQKIAAKLRENPGAVDVDTSLILGRPELRAVIDRDRAADLGVQVGDIAATLQLNIAGVEVGTFAEAGEQYDILVRAKPDARETERDLSALRVPSALLGQVPLLDVIQLERTSGPDSINRYQRQRQVLITSNLRPGAAAGTVVEALDAEVKKMGLPPGYSAGAAGQTKEIAKTFKSFMIAFGLSIVFMYLILAAQFESWVHPFTILLSLPLTVPFALVSLLLLGQQLDIYSMLGILVLFGVVKKNSILQIDRINQLRERGLERRDAVIQGSRDRLRPILMTTVAFVAGMIPLVMSTGVGAAFNRATAGVVVGGQTLSLVLTLLVTPVAYTLLDDLVRAATWLRNQLRLAPRPAAETGAAETDENHLEQTMARVRAHATDRGSP